MTMMMMIGLDNLPPPPPGSCTADTGHSHESVSWNIPLNTDAHPSLILVMWLNSLSDNTNSSVFPQAADLNGAATHGSVSEFDFCVL